MPTMVVRVEVAPALLKWTVHRADWDEKTADRLCLGKDMRYLRTARSALQEVDQDMPTAEDRLAQI
ncbi:hypothetical protein [Actinomyces israelii]|uniref:hypothetical protein n=1 Tax=Actinomyces israelii TaxID=1659 RepID=UPI0023542314|nr:hypothetical protein [Actinomyces israelii]